MNKVRDRINLYHTLGTIIPIAMAALALATGHMSGYVLALCALIWSFFVYKANSVVCPGCGGRIRILFIYKLRCSRCEKYY